MTYPGSYPDDYPASVPGASITAAGAAVAERPGWPQVIVEGAFPGIPPVQAPGTLLLDDPAFGLLGTAILGAADAWSDLSAWVRSGSVSQPATRQQGPLWSSGAGTASVVLRNDDGRFDPDNLAGPYAAAGVSALAPMVPVRIRATWDGVTYPLYGGFADSWEPEDGSNYAGRYAQATLAATDGQKVLAGVKLPAVTPAGAGELAGARVRRILNLAGWYTGTERRHLDAGNSALNAYAGGDTAWNLMQAAADAEIGDLYLDGSGTLVFRERHAILTDGRSNTVQAVFGDSPGTVEADGTEAPYWQLTRSRDDATLANDVQATRVGGGLQHVRDAASIARYLFPRSYSRTDLILADDRTARSWAQWVLYVAAGDADRFDQLVIYPLRDPVNLWPQALGRKRGDRIQVWRRPPGVTSPVVKDVFIRGISHSWDWSRGTWATTWTLQDAAKYGSFLVLDDPARGQLGANALAF